VDRRHVGCRSVDDTVSPVVRGLLLSRKESRDRHVEGLVEPVARFRSKCVGVVERWVMKRDRWIER
jgi:hypothetical protein